MEIIYLMLSISVAVILFISGILKFLSLNELYKKIAELLAIDNFLVKIIGTVIPLFELLISVLLITYNESIFVNIISIIMTGIFISMNINGVAKRSLKDCLCFGKFFKTKLGYGGLIQSVLLFLSLIPGLLFKTTNSINFLFYEHNLSDITLVLFVSLLWSITLFIIRIQVDTILYPQLDSK
ncbi:Methylamine utilization protein MauE [compost metagenome]